jgi:hypothetical protein
VRGAPAKTETERHPISYDLSSSNGILNHFHQLEHSLLACHTVRGAFEALMPRADKVTASSALWWEE